ncbi:MAG: cobalamin-binding protein [Candidatus Wallbacteria bacterium HGW-Wallbacteria-1]|jgi:5-methyltetrahydrofolate--homocysteine methyltransferase|uniref:Cobalamin-binding protein n=1 Tax=Candidatus Wallbacteria bacterium HGW-Wallbacteria-1 TaxID=2013854 RepID=A0A2N1PKN1_9BACT|nr:MAG: cobalamin-binding protein [Candidatus Wallbacteria bacterium HGW-Wallbacteria-1]
MTTISALQNEYFQALCMLDESRACDVIHRGLDNGFSPEDLLIKIVIESIDRMNESLLVDQEINLAQHYLSARISENMAMLLLAKFPSGGDSPGCIVLGTSIGDYHGLGKKIVAGCLRAHLFQVIDAGTHVSPEQFVDLAITHNAQIIGISSMMAHTAIGPEGALGVRKILQEQGLESRIKIMVGGAPYRFDRELYRRVQADGWGENGLAAVETARRLIMEVTP